MLLIIVNIMELSDIIWKLVNPRKLFYFHSPSPSDYDHYMYIEMLKTNKQTLFQALKVFHRALVLVEESTRKLENPSCRIRF